MGDDPVHYTRPMLAETRRRSGSVSFGTSQAAARRQKQRGQHDCRAFGCIVRRATSLAAGERALVACIVYQRRVARNVAGGGTTMSTTFAGLLRDFNVEVVEPARAYCRGARQTCAGQTLARIFQTRGYDHLRMVLMSFIETRPNKKALVGPAIWVVSDVLNARPDWLGQAWLEFMDDTDLAELFERACANYRLAQPRPAMAVLIFERMRVRLEARPAERLAA
jgi:hypothetical protein